MDIESLGDCPVCLEPLGNSTLVMTHCCKQRMDLLCYVRCLPKCPFCRASQDAVPNVQVVINDWRRLTKVLSTTIVACAAASIVTVLYYSSSTC